MNYKRKRPKNRRAGCLLCKPNKMNGWGKSKLGHRGFDRRVDGRELVGDVAARLGVEQRGAAVADEQLSVGRLRQREPHAPRNPGGGLGAAVRNARRRAQAHPAGVH